MSELCLCVCVCVDKAVCACASGLEVWRSMSRGSGQGATCGIGGDCAGPVKCRRQGAF